MRATASILHLDLDAFFASVEQRDKPSLRGRPVVVGGIGPRGVVSTASYEARRYGVRSAMPTAEARRRCPHAAYLSGRFDAYRAASRIVMGLLHELSPLVEQLSIDEAYVDLAAGGHDLAPDALVGLADRLRGEVAERTHGLTASVGLGSSKFMAKVASEMAKPDGVAIVAPGTEVATIAPLSARAVPGIGPATMERLERLAVRTVGDLQRLSEKELVRELGRAWGESLAALAFARDDRPVVSSREMKSVSQEHTFEVDVRDREELGRVLDRDAVSVAQRVQRARVFARTVTIKVRRADFSTHTRSRTLLGATDSAETFARVGRELLAGVEIAGGVRLIGLGASNFAAAAQEELFAWRDVADTDEEGWDTPTASGSPERPGVTTSAERAERVEATTYGPVPTRYAATPYRPGADVVHAELGRGWVWGSGLGRVTVRFETRETPPGPVRTFSVDDPALAPATPLD